jgi:hypothetical protein
MMVKIPRIPLVDHIAASVIFWYLFERTAQALSRRLIRKPPTPPSSLVAI